MPWAGQSSGFFCGKCLLQLAALLVGGPSLCPVILRGRRGLRCRYTGVPSRATRAKSCGSAAIASKVAATLRCSASSALSTRPAVVRAFARCKKVVDKFRLPQHLVRRDERRAARSRRRLAEYASMASSLVTAFRQQLPISAYSAQRKPCHCALPGSPVRGGRRLQRPCEISRLGPLAQFARISPTRCRLTKNYSGAVLLGSPADQNCSRMESGPRCAASAAAYWRMAFERQIPIRL